MSSAYAAWAARWRVPLGFLLGIAYLYFSLPTVWILAAGGAVAAAGVALRAYAAGHLAKNQNLAISGPYAWTRNPLYLGSALMAAGFAWAGRSWALGLACAVLFTGVYWPVICREEEYLRRQFGDAYDDYARAVPLFLPKLTGPRFRPASAGGKFQWKQYWKNREYEALLGYVGIVIFLAFKIWLR